MDSEVMQYIERVLKKNEQVKYYFDIDYEKAGKKGSCIFAIIKHLAEAHQYAIFFIQTSMIFNYTIEQVFPFTKELLIEKIDALNFTLGWQGKEGKIKIQCKNATDLTSFLKFYESYKNLYMPSTDNAFQKRISHNWVWHYSDYIDPEVRTLMTPASPQGEGQETQLDQQFKVRIGGMGGLAQNLSSDISMQNRMKEAYIIEQLRVKKAEYSIEEDISIYTITYNAGGKKPKPGLEMPTAFFTGKSVNNDQSLENLLNLPDMYVVCIQEVCPLNAKTAIVKTDHAQVWEDFLLKSLNEFSVKKSNSATEYVKIAAKDMVGLFAVVFIRKDKAEIFNAADSSTTEVAVGVFGIVGNKGAVGISLRLHESKLCIINSHFSSDQDKVKQRIHDYKTISSKALFEVKGRSCNIFEHDIILWAGDLNFRTNVKSIDEAIGLLNENRIEALVGKDQLTIEKTKGNIFKEFQEGQIRFWPTYKYAPGSAEFDRETKREPGWCDRILFKGNIEQIFYTSIESFGWSDHKPVAALFRTKIYKSEEGKKTEVLKKAKDTFMKLLKKTVPKPVIDKTEVNVQNVRYGVEAKESLTLSNMGESIMEFRIQRKEDPMLQSATWLTVKPTFGVLLPNQSVSISVQILVTYEEAQQLHSNPQYLKSAVDIRTSDGKAFDIKITGAFVKTCFGADLPLLNSVHEGFATLDPKLTSKELIDRCIERLLIPKEVYVLTQWTVRNALRTEKLFVLVGKEDDKIGIREFLDKNVPVPSNVDPYAVADTLIELLESTREGVVPADFIADTVKEYEDCGDENDKVCELFLMKLPPESAVLVIYLLSFCKHLLEFSDYNNLSVDILAKMLCACLVKIDSTEWDQAYLLEEDSERKIKIAQIGVKRKLRFQGVFALLLKQSY